MLSTMHLVELQRERKESEVMETEKKENGKELRRKRECQSDIIMVGWLVDVVEISSFLVCCY
jgi:hypothetical protein